MTHASTHGGRRQRFGALTPKLLLGVIALLTACSDSGRAAHFSLANGLTSAREEEAARHNAGYARRLRLVTQVARTVKTDSLRKLYLVSLDAPKGTIDTVWFAIGCEYLRHMEQVGAPAAKRAEEHLLDSLLTSPDVARRWAAAQTRMSGYGSLQGCWPSRTPVPDSLEYLPYPNQLPF